jgi:hypothetical protein
LLTVEGDQRPIRYQLAALGGSDGIYAARLVKDA